jgi:glycosyltransferase involved in cell wall biosynthesis
MNKSAIKELDFTVAIPTYNGAKRFPQVLDRLLTQTGLENINWEIIVVDNNSYDNTFEIIQKYQKNCNRYNSNFQLKYCLETEQGITFARLRAVSEAKGKFIAFLDDDNLPAPDWVLQSYLFGKEHPQAGAWSGQIHGAFEVKPPENFSRIQAFLAIREHGQEPYLFDADNLILPPGAALVIRKQAWRESVPQQLSLKGRIGKLMVSGDDLEILLHLHKSSWEIWYNPVMHVDHQIPHWRLEKDYLMNLARGCGLCIFQLRLINAKNWQKPILIFRTILGNLRRILYHLIKYRGQLENNIIALFEIEFYLSSMLSPFYSLIYYFNQLAVNNTNINHD